jgi:hypothetical protein
LINDEVENIGGSGAKEETQEVNEWQDEWDEEEADDAFTTHLRQVLADVQKK